MYVDEIRVLFRLLWYWRNIRCDNINIDLFYIIIRVYYWLFEMWLIVFNEMIVLR